MSNFPPVLARQAAMAQRRETARDEAVSVSSWDPIEEEDDLALPPADLSFSRMDPIPEGQAAAAPKAAPPAPPAPVTQAAQGWLNHDYETASSRRLRKQQERAQRKGYRNARAGNLGGVHNAVNTQLPPHLAQVGSGQDERSILVVDSRDQRLQSPFQGWVLDEILMNARSHVNVLSDRQLIRSPNTGYHFNLFYMKTLTNMKLVITGTMTSYTSVPCGHWDAETGRILSHAAFQPFRWPLMCDDSPTWVDIKLKLEGTLLLHLELRGYRSDMDMSVQINYVADGAVRMLEEKVFIPTVIVTVFQGWRIVATSWEVGGRIYACSSGGVVVALDHPLCHFEARLVATSSADALGLDADRVEFRFLSASDRLDVACSTAAIPPTWLVVSRVSGPTLIKNAKWCRDHYARVEGPDQTLQMSQLATIHAHWTAAIEAPTIDEVGPRISAIAVDSHESNMHLICESPLFKAGRHLVDDEALALQAHDPNKETVTQVVPPIDDGPAVRPVRQGGVQALLGPVRSDSVSLTPVGEAKPSITEPGTSPLPSSLASGSLAPVRRTLAERRSDGIDQSAVTPQHFVTMVQQARDGGSAAPREEKGLVIEMAVGSLDQSDDSGAPMSYGPNNPLKQ